MRIAFDLDGTLVDSIEHIHHAASLALRDLDLPAIDRTTMQSFVGRGLPAAMTQVLDHLGAPQTRHDELTAKMLGHYTCLPSDPASVFPGVIDALSELRAAGHDLSVCTNKPYQAALNALRDTRLLPHFDLVIGGDSLLTRKPDPGMLRACAPDLYVGDSEVDAETSRAADVPFLLFTEGYRKSALGEIPHHASFSAFSALPSLARKYFRE